MANWRYHAEHGVSHSHAPDPAERRRKAWIVPKNSGQIHFAGKHIFYGRQHIPDDKT
jgi:hypothetical protein